MTGWLTNQMESEMDLVKGEAKQAGFWLLGLTIFVTLVCVIHVSTYPRYAPEYLTGVAFGSAAGSIAGAVLGYASRICLTGVYAMAARFK